MAFEIVIGRDARDREKYGLRGTILLGKHYVQMGGRASLANPVLLDASRSHVVFICGKRGSGKSYTMGVLAEGFMMLPRDVRERLSVIMFDTMGVFWTMKYPNREDEKLVEEWALPQPAFNVRLLVPAGRRKEYERLGVPVDDAFVFSLRDVDPDWWLGMTKIDPLSPLGVLLVRMITELQKGVFGFEEIYAWLRGGDDFAVERHVLENIFRGVEGWGLFAREGTPLASLAQPGMITILDVSGYANASATAGLRGVVIGLVSQKLFETRMLARRVEEYAAVRKAVHVFEKRAEDEEPLVWLFVDEAHEFLPRVGETLASRPLITLLREGRQPGVSLVLASQQPGQIHTDVLTQSDVVISHRLTAKIDTDALGLLMQSYMREGLDVLASTLPRIKGAALVFDDTNEKIFQIQVRPRVTWHGGSSPTALSR